MALQGSLKEPLFLGIDLGTSACKVSVINKKGNIVAQASEKYPLYILEGGGAEQNPKEWWKAIVKAVSRINESIDVNSIKAIGVTGQWSGTVAIDINGEPLMNAIIWLDSRGEKYIKNLIKGIFNFSGYDIFKLINWIRKTGGAPSRSGKDSLAHILFIKNERPEIYQQTYKFLEPISYINFKLTNRLVSSYDIMITYWITDNRNIKNIKYDEKLIKIAGIEKEKLPELSKPYEIIGKLTHESASELGLLENIPVIAGGGDIQTSLIGAGCIEDYETLIYIGTSSWVAANVSFKKTDVFNNIASIPSALPNKYFIAAEQECAGKCLEFISECFNIRLEEMDNYAKDSTIGSNGIIFTPWLYGERAPVEDRYLRGIIFNLSLNSNKSDIVHSIYEGISLNIRWIFDPVQKLMKKKIEKIKLAGGCARSDLLPAILANVLNVEVNVVEDPVFVNSKGIAMLAAYSVGEIELKAISKLIRISKQYKPTDVSKRYDSIFRYYLKIYKNNKKIFKEINSRYLYKIKILL
jgi:xylulokinase